jgi:hypothetical protein
VDVVGALPAGTNNIGDVDVLSVVPGTGATNLGKAEDAAHTTGDVGVMALAVRFDAGGAIAGTDLDYSPLQVDASGALRITGGGGGTEYTEDVAAAADPVGGAVVLVRKDTPATVTTTDGDNVAQRGTNYGAAYCQIVTSAGAFVDSFSGSGGTSATDDGAFTAAVGAGTPIMGFATADAVDSGDVGVLAMDTSRNLKVILQSNSGVDVGDVTLTAGTATNEFVGDVAHDAAIAGNPLTIGGVASAAAPTDVSADQDAVRSWHLRNGAQAVNLTAAGALIPGDATNGLDVDVIRLPASTNTLEVVGDVAHDAANAGNPVKVGAVASNSIEGLTQVANADVSDVRADLNGCLIVRPYTTLEESINERVSNTNGTSTDFTGAFAAGGAGVHNYITTVIIHNGHATTNGYVDLRSGAAGAIVATIPAPAGGGSVVNFAVPLKFADNTAVAYAVSAAITTVYITVVGFQAQG